MSLDYWIEAVENSFDEAGVKATKKQIKSIAEDIKISHEQYDMAFGYDIASFNLTANKQNEIDNLYEELQKERKKKNCEYCKGKGYIRDNFGTFSSESEYCKCRGDGRL